MFASSSAEIVVARDVASRDIADPASYDIDLLDRSLLNTRPRHAVERQLLAGDLMGVAIMCCAVLWSVAGVVA